MRHHIARRVVMIEPRSFCSNPETAASNAFQKNAGDQSPKQILRQAQSEFLNFQNLLRSNGIEVLSFVEDEKQNTPDALFPNNWFCHLPSGEALVFPMFARNRQREVRQDVLQTLKARNILDLSPLLEKNEFLEGTGSLILDHGHKRAYACYSPRTTAGALNVFAEKTGYQVMAFSAVDENAKAIYHTNVMMALGATTAVVLLSSIHDPQEKEALIRALRSTGKDLAEISFSQMRSFAGNMLFLQNQKGQNFWVCSQRAFESLTSANKKVLEADGTFLYAPLDTIETYGGGGARCLLAEVF